MTVQLSKDSKAMITAACIGAEIRGFDRVTFQAQVVEELDRNGGFNTAENVRAGISTVLGRQAGRYRARSADFGSD
jgi:hypothetical protein